MAEQAWTLGGLLDWTAKHLAQKGSESPRLDAEVLLAHAVGCKRIDLYGLRHGEDASPEVRARYKDLIKKRVEGCPVAYLVGKKEFYGMPFPSAPMLIPRPARTSRRRGPGGGEEAHARIVDVARLRLRCGDAGGCCRRRTSPRRRQPRRARRREDQRHVVRRARCAPRRRPARAASPPRFDLVVLILLCHRRLPNLPVGVNYSPGRPRRRAGNTRGDPRLAAQPIRG